MLSSVAQLAAPAVIYSSPVTTVPVDNTFEENKRELEAVQQRISCLQRQINLWSSPFFVDLPYTQNRLSEAREELQALQESKLLLEQEKEKIQQTSEALLASNLRMPQAITEIFPQPLISQVKSSDVAEGQKTITTEIDMVLAFGFLKLTVKQYAQKASAANLESRQSANHLA